MSFIRTTLLLLGLSLGTLGLGGCATGPNPKDPFEKYNRGMYQFNEAVDKAVLKPVAKAYNTVMPPPGKMMASNFFSNLGDIVVTINDLLQFKLLQAVSDGGRFVVNTTVGLFGLADVATAVGLKKHNEDFGQTLGHWGIQSGPYVVLPLLGPSSIRDGAGLYADSNVGAYSRIKNVRTRNQLVAASVVEKRANLLDNEQMLDEAAVDRYSFIRDAYLQHRQSLVYDGNPPRIKYDDEEEDAPTGLGALNETGQAQEPVASAIPVDGSIAVVDETPAATSQQPVVNSASVSQQRETH